jgi:hypothetical protein
MFFSPIPRNSPELASQARHELVSPQETITSRNVVLGLTRTAPRAGVERIHVREGRFHLRRAYGGRDGGLDDGAGTQLPHCPANHKPQSGTAINRIALPQSAKRDRGPSGHRRSSPAERDYAGLGYLIKMSKNAAGMNPAEEMVPSRSERDSVVKSPCRAAPPAAGCSPSYRIQASTRPGGQIML